MPHDARGRLLKAGDKVVMTFEVRDVSTCETAWNVTLQALDDLQTGEYAPQVACNSRLVHKVACGC